MASFWRFPRRGYAFIERRQFEPVEFGDSVGAWLADLGVNNPAGGGSLHRHQILVRRHPRPAAAFAPRRARALEIYSMYARQLGNSEWIKSFWGTRHPTHSRIATHSGISESGTHESHESP